MSRSAGNGGASIADHYKAVARATGRPLPKPPALPPEARYLWDTFVEITRRRQSSGFGRQPITHSEIMAWSTLKQWPLAPWEVDALCALDDAYLDETAPQPQK